MSTFTVSIDSLNAPAVEACRHCGDPCGAHTHRTDAEVFCCAGCASVFALLDQHGLTGFYAAASAPGRSQKAGERRHPSRFATFDEPAVAERLVTSHGDQCRVTLQTPSVHCASCLWLLEQLWRIEPGVRRAEASLLRRTVTVDFDPSQTSLRRVAEQLAALGYEPVVDAEPVADRVPAIRRRLYLQLGVAGFAFGNMMLFSIPRYVNGAPLEPAFQRLFDTLNLLFALPVLLFSASDYFISAARAARARVVTLDVPIALGLLVLFGRSVFEIVTTRGEGFLDSFAGLVFFLLIGRLFQRKAFDAVSFDRTVRSFLPLSVQAVRDGVATRLPIEQLLPGDAIVLRAQEVVPADSTLDQASGLIDYAFVTGEQEPVQVAHGATVQAGGRVVGETLRLVVARAVAHSHLARLWTDSVFARPKRHWLDDVLVRFGRAFTLASLFLAVAGALWWWPDAGRAAEVATAVLIIACPCALTLAAPLTLGTAMGVLGRSGVYVKAPAVVLDMSRITAAVFDKTGTLTSSGDRSTADLSAVDDGDRRFIQRLAAHSVHPISRAVAGTPMDTAGVTGVEEEAGRGLQGLVDARHVALGSAAFIRDVTGHATPDQEHVVWASIDRGRPIPITLVSIERPGIRNTIQALGATLFTRLLSGDHAGEAGRWRSVFGDRMTFGLTPDDKLGAVRRMRAAGHRVLMIGDGLNDAGALAAADVGLAVSDNTACMVPACDAIVSGDRLSDLDAILAYARRARRVIAWCFSLSVAYNLVGLAFALTGHLTPLATAILMPVSSLTIVGLSVGAMRLRAPWERAR
jgi:Cu+-exporting ATPase